MRSERTTVGGAVRSSQAAAVYAAKMSRFAIATGVRSSARKANRSHNAAFLLMFQLAAVGAEISWWIVDREQVVHADEKIWMVQ